MFQQLNPTVPVIVTSKNNRAGEAFILLERSAEHHIYWGVIFDDTGEVWWVPNPEIRVCNNWTAERPPRKKYPYGFPPSEPAMEAVRELAKIDLPRMEKKLKKHLQRLERRKK